MFHVPLFDCPKLRSQRCWGVPRKILKLNVLFGCLFFFPTTPPTLSPPSSLAPPSFLLYLLKCSRTLTAIWEEKLAKVTPLLLSLILYQYVVDLPNTLEVTKRILLIETMYWVFPSWQTFILALWVVYWLFWET